MKDKIKKFAKDNEAFLYGAGLTFVAVSSYALAQSFHKEMVFRGIGKAQIALLELGGSVTMTNPVSGMMVEMTKANLLDGTAQFVPIPKGK